MFSQPPSEESENLAENNRENIALHVPISHLLLQKCCISFLDSPPGLSHLLYKLRNMIQAEKNNLRAPGEKRLKIRLQKLSCLQRFYVFEKHLEL